MTAEDQQQIFRDLSDVLISAQGQLDPDTVANRRARIVNLIQSMLEHRNRSLYVL